MSALDSLLFLFFNHSRVDLFGMAVDGARDPNPPPNTHTHTPFSSPGAATDEGWQWCMRTAPDATLHEARAERSHVGGRLATIGGCD